MVEPIPDRTTLSGIRRGIAECECRQPGALYVDCGWTCDFVAGLLAVAEASAALLEEGFRPDGPTPGQQNLTWALDALDQT